MLFRLFYKMLSIERVDLVKQRGISAEYSILD